LKIADLERSVAAQIIALMQTDGLAWANRWARQMPAQNGITGHVYTGTNVLMTGFAMLDRGITDPRFVTFKQARAAGGSVKKGAKGIPIMFCGSFTGQNEDGSERKGSFAKITHVFAVADIENLPETALVAAPAPVSDEPRFRDQRIDLYVRNSGVAIRNAPAAYYIEALDSIGIPPIDAFTATPGFTASEAYYSTLLHELIHATGSKARLDRQCKRDYHRDKQARAREELVAEIGAAMLCQKLGLIPAPRVDHAAYVASWCKLLADKPGEIFTAASAAGKGIALLDALQAPQAREQAA
jgi:antirestriction protein ArdC